MKVNVFHKALVCLLSFIISINNLAFSKVEANSDYENGTGNKSVITSEVRAAMEKTNEKIPVVIWRKQVDDSYIEEIIYKKTGFKINDLEEDYSSPTQELIEQLAVAATDNGTLDLKGSMKNHMDLTRVSRSIETTKTNQYIAARRSALSDYYSADSKSFINDTCLSELEVKFASQYSPMIVCLLSPEKINELSEREDIEEIMLYKKMDIVECAFPQTTMKDTMGINDINQHLSLTGSGVKIGIYETSVVSPTYNDYELDMSKVTVIGSPYIGSYMPHHATWCASVAAGNKGVAPDAEIYSASLEHDFQTFSWGDYDNVQLSQLEDLISNGVKIINISWNSQNDESCYNYWQKYTDYLIAYNKVTIVCATGNNSASYIGSPSAAYNCIAVNGFTDVNPSNNEKENVLCDYSYDNGSGCLKPDVIATTFGLMGTSTATPVISGMIALLIQYKPSLAAHPELVKSILMASCHKKASKLYNSNGTITSLNETMFQGLTSRQGAGIPNMYTMISIAAQHSYACGILNGTTSTQVLAHIFQPQYGAKYMNVSMSYLLTNVSPDNTAGTADDYDMFVSNNLIQTKYSTKSNSSTEMIYFTLPDEDIMELSDNIYNLQIYRAWGDSTNIAYGYAWSTDTTKFVANEEDEGIFFLRNNNSNLYLTTNSSTLEIKQSAFTGNTNQMWILKQLNSPSKYVLQSASGNKYGIKIGGELSTSQYKAVEGNEVDVNSIYVTFNDDGTFTFKQNYNNRSLALGIYGSSVSSNAYSSWMSFSSNNKSQKWALETVQYRRGDVNTDGLISNDDASLIQQYMLSSVAFNNLQMYIGDANNDGIINLADSIYILQGEL